MGEKQAICLALTTKERWEENEALSLTSTDKAEVGVRPGFIVIIPTRERELGRNLKPLWLLPAKEGQMGEIKARLFVYHPQTKERWREKLGSWSITQRLRRDGKKD